MEKLKFEFYTKLAFSQPIYHHQFALRILPTTNHIQTICSLNWSVCPSESLWLNEDCFGNRYCCGKIMAEHDDFQFSAEGIAFVNQAGRMKEVCHPMYQYETNLTRINQNGGLHSFYEACCRGIKGNEYERALQWMNQIYKNMTYCGGVTGIHTTAEDSFALKQGVCQDFAHIMLALCRCNQIPARYVVGMMVGEGATHAWVEIYYDGAWYAMDPTHNCLVNDEYIKMAQGRDYRDCAIDRGCFQGYAQQNQEVSVRVEKL
ncbi:MAG: transglutaminase domain-containing protein [Lachnospiraceae bacterium]